MPRMPASASASRIARTWFVGPPVPVDRLARLDVASTTAARSSGSGPELLDERRRARRTCRPRGWRAPGPRLIRYHGSSAVGSDRKHLVVRLEQPALLVQQQRRSTRGGSPRSGASRTRSWLRPAIVDRVELDRAQPVERRPRTLAGSAGSDRGGRGGGGARGSAGRRRARARAGRGAAVRRVGGRHAQTSSSETLTEARRLSEDARRADR